MDIAELNKKIDETVSIYTKIVEKIKNEGSKGSGESDNNKESGKA